MKKIKKILIISSDRHLRDILHFCFDGWGYETFIVVTLINKRQLREQLLTLKQGVDDYLIKPPDPLDLRTRIEMSIKRAQYSHYLSPLTGLPGVRLIEEAIQEKIAKEENFSFGHIDIDNFKCFNKEICQYFIVMFDNLITLHYPPKDRKEGYITAKDRTNKKILFDLKYVTDADTAGLAMIINLFKQMKDSGSGGRIGLINLSQKMRDLLEISKLNKVFKEYLSERRAIASLLKS